MQEEEKSVEPSPLPEVESKTKSKIKKTIIRDENGNRLTKSGAIEGNKENLMKSGKEEEGRWWCSQDTANGRG